jgi:hypothetical protein
MADPNPAIPKEAFLVGPGAGKAKTTPSAKKPVKKASAKVSKKAVAKKPAKKKK